MQAFLSSLTDQETLALEYEWPFWGRPEQLPPPGDWRIWQILSGRGWGKTRTGAEWVRYKVETGQAKRIALVSDTAADVRDVMIEGDAGLLSVCPPWDRPTYEPSKRRLTWPNGAVAVAYAAEAPDLLRGPQHDCAWADEIAKWRNLKKSDAQGGTAWDNLMMGLRVGANPQCVVTTTPRPIPLIKALRARANTVTTVGTSYENRANLSDQWYSEVIAPYEGTRLGRQEIYAELLEDVPGALWQRDQIDALRVFDAPELTRIVVAIDPAATSHEGANETGMIVAGLGVNGHGYVLADLSGHYSPGAWGDKAVRAYVTWMADRIIGETNNGGEMVGHTVRLSAQAAGVTARYLAVTASRGKAARAEPIAALYEQGKVHHVGSFAGLEDQLCTWVPGEDSPDRLDALVWALSDLCVTRRRPEVAVA